MPSTWIVKPFYVVERVRTSILPCPIVLFAQPFGLERRKEALHCGVFPAVSAAAHAAYDAVGLKQTLKVLAGLLKALVGMM